MAGVITEKRQLELETMQKQLRDLDNFIQDILDGKSSMAKLAEYLKFNSQNLNSAMNSGLFALLRASKILTNEDIISLLRDSMSPAERLIRCVLHEDNLTVLTIPEEESVINVVEQALTGKQLQVVKYRFGMGDGKAKTLADAANHFGVTTIRIGQIEAKALRALRQPKWLRMLLPDYDLRMLELQETRAMVSTREALDIELETAKNASDVKGLFSVSIDNLNLSVRAYNSLQRAKIDTVGDVAALKISDLSRIRNLGKLSIQEVVNAMKTKYGVIIENDIM